MNQPEIEFTPSELATIRADLAACEREAAINEAAKKVADAAVAGQIAWESYRRICNLLPIDFDAKADAVTALEQTRTAMNAAVREYRALTESPLSPAKQAVIEEETP